MIMVNKFNKLYNIILQSIINQNKETRKAMIEKSTAIPASDKTKIMIFLSDLPNKTADFLCRFFCSGQIKSTTDPKVKQVIQVLNRNTTVNIQQKVALKDFLNQNKKYIEREEGKNIDLDSIPQFSQKREYGNGVVVYKVRDSRSGKHAVRKIIDQQYGQDRNPWCLISRGEFEDGLDSWHFWVHYNAYPKHVAFQNGKLIAFSANSQPETIWWDMSDYQHDKLIAYNDDGSSFQVDTPQYKPYTYAQKAKLFFEINKQTGRYDYHGPLTITDEDLVDGHFPIPFGVIYGDFNCYDCNKLTSLQNGPIQVKDNFFASGCKNLKSLKGAPEKVGGIFDVADCISLSSLEGIPENYDEFYCDGCISLSKKDLLIYGLNRTRLKYNEETDTYNYIGPITISDEHLQNGHLPIKFYQVRGNFYFEKCDNLTSLEGCPEIVEGDFIIKECNNLKSLVGAPNEVDCFICTNCSKLITLQGAPQYVEHNFDCENNVSLSSLVGAPKEVGGNFECNHTAITSLEGAPESVGGAFMCYDCKNLKTLDGMPKKIVREFIIHTNYNLDGKSILKELNNLKYIPSDIYINRKYAAVKNKLKAAVKGVIVLWD